MEKRISQMYKDLCVGDTVVVYVENNRRYDPQERTVAKIGKKYIYTDSSYASKYDRDCGYAEFGHRLFPGTLEEYYEWKETTAKAKTLLNRFASEIFDLTIEELKQIETILNGEDN